MIRKLIRATFPPKLIKVLESLSRDYISSHEKISYSQEGEDMILRQIFIKAKKTSPGFYVDIGAHHPKRYSNTHFFYKQGWQGINVDAMPGSMSIFNKLRSRDINIEQPISKIPELLTYYSFSEPAVNGFSQSLSKDRSDSGSYKLISKKKIKTTTLKNILDDNLPEDTEIDFLSIDVEGLDLDVLQSNDFNKYRPKVIIVEILETNFSRIGDNEVSKYLLKYAYTIYGKSVNSVIFIENDFLDAMMI